MNELNNNNFNHDPIDENTDAVRRADESSSSDSDAYSDYDRNKYGVSYSPDGRNGYNNFQYGNYPPTASQNESRHQNAGKKTKKKSVKTVLMVLAVMICVVSATFGGVAGAYLITQYSDFGYNNNNNTDGFNNGGIHIGDTGTTENSDSEDENDAPKDVIGGIYINESDDKTSMETDFTSVVSKTLESVVEINTESVEYSQWSGQYIVKGAGSGVIISSDDEDQTVYYVVTNHHVIDGAEDILVRLNSGREYQASLISSDSITDVALLSIKVDAGVTLSVAETISSDVKLLDGQDIYVIGNPLGELGGSVAKGIISKTARQISVSGVKMKLMQIDAAVNPGNSGGGLFDMSGRLIGIVNAKYSDEGIEGLGFAIPIATVKYVVSELATYGYVTGRPGLGLGLADKAYTTGSLINSTTVTYPTVTADSEVTGTYIDENGETVTFTFKKDDIIFGLNDVSITSTAALMSCLTEYKVNDTVTVSVYRQVIKSSGNRDYYTTEEYKVSVVLTEYIPIE